MKPTQILACLLVFSCFTISCNAQKDDKMKSKKSIRYVALGDSYTICEGASVNESWPVLLTKHLNEKGIEIDLIANPSITGFTTQNLIEKELPVLQKSKADFVTLLIGVNDWVRGVDTSFFGQNLSYILDEIEKNISVKKNIVLITIPDFGVTPVGAAYSSGRDISKGIAEFNAIILKEAHKRKLQTVDIFELSKQMKESEELIAHDGLHPSAKEYALWESSIFPIVEQVLKK